MEPQKDVFEPKRSRESRSVNGGVKFRFTGILTGLFHLDDRDETLGPRTHEMSHPPW